MRKTEKRPASVEQFLGKSRREMPLADWIMATGVGLLCNELRGSEAERVERNDGWRREPFLWKYPGKRKRRHWEHLDGLDVAWILPLLTCFLYLCYIRFFVLVAYLSRLCFCLTSGASFPERVQPAAEGGGSLFYVLRRRVQGLGGAQIAT
jgi:hypothetical protein